MMKNIIIVLSLLFLFNSCEKPSDCIESTGDIITKEFPVTDFLNVYVHTGIKLVVTQGPTYKVVVETGENLMSDIEVKQEGNAITFKDNTSCNWVREYGHTTVYVTAPNLVEIHSKTEKDIVSNGVLTYPYLRLFSMDLGPGAGTNDFHFQIAGNLQLIIETNNVSRFYISGDTQQALVNFYDGNSRFEGANLIAQEILVFHRGSNDMILNPIQKVTGKMVSTGNIILKNNPPIVDVQELYHGKVIYN